MIVTRRRLPWIGVSILIMCCIYCTIVLSVHDWDILTFVDIGSQFAEGNLAGTSGYDDQFSYYIAIDFLSAPARIDDLPYQYQRILYLLVVNVSSLGQKSLVLWVMVSVNVVALSISIELPSRLLRRDVMSLMLSGTFILWVVQVFSLPLCLNEPLCFQFIPGQCW